MAGSVNKVTLVGNLGKDPEIRFLPDGMKVASFSIATSETWKDKGSGERKEKTEWHRVSVMNDRVAEVAEKYLRKGSKVFVEGQIQSRKWTDQSGIERVSTDIVISRFKGELVLLDSKNSAYAEDSFGSSSKSDDALFPSSDASSENHFDALDDDIPF